MTIQAEVRGDMTMKATPPLDSTRSPYGPSSSPDVALKNENTIPNSVELSRGDGSRPDSIEAVEQFLNMKDLIRNPVAASVKTYPPAWNVSTQPIEGVYLIGRYVQRLIHHSNVHSGYRRYS